MNDPTTNFDQRRFYLDLKGKTSDPATLSILSGLVLLSEKTSEIIDRIEKIEERLSE